MHRNVFFWNANEYKSYNAAVDMFAMGKYKQYIETLIFFL